MRKYWQIQVACGIALLATLGCGGGQTEAPRPQANVDGSKYMLDAAPEGAQHVIAARESAQQDDEVVIEGRIGGRAKPWIEGQAAFLIVDPSLKACSDREGDQCTQPWDYCCETNETLAASQALVKVVDEQGDVVQADARDLLKVKELQTVVVRGKAQRNEAGDLTVLATGVYVKP